MTFYKNIYAYNILTNLDIFTLHDHHCSHTGHDNILQIDCKIDTLHDTYIVNLDPASQDFVVQFGDVISFKYKKNENILHTISPQENHIHDFITNAPFSILTALEGGLLLHASVIIIEGQAYAFLASCGTGKSTLAFCLLQNTNISYFSDDSAAVFLNDGKLMLYRGSRYLKVGQQLLADFNIPKSICKKTSDEKGKYYISFPDKYHPDVVVPLKKVFFLDRSPEYTKVVVQKLPSQPIAPLLLQGLVGYQNLCSNNIIRGLLLKNVKTVEKYMNAYKLSIPNGMHYMDTQFIEKFIV